MLQPFLLSSCAFAFLEPLLNICSLSSQTFPLTWVRLTCLLITQCVGSIMKAFSQACYIRVHTFLMYFDRSGESRLCECDRSVLCHMCCQSTYGVLFSAGRDFAGFIIWPHSLLHILCPWEFALVQCVSPVSSTSFLARWFGTLVPGAHVSAWRTPETCLSAVDAFYPEGLEQHCTEKWLLKRSHFHRCPIIVTACKRWGRKCSARCLTTGTMRGVIVDILLCHSHWLCIANISSEYPQSLCGGKKRCGERVDQTKGQGLKMEFVFHVCFIASILNVALMLSVWGCTKGSKFTQNLMLSRRTCVGVSRDWQVIFLIAAKLPFPVSLHSSFHFLWLLPFLLSGTFTYYFLLTILELCSSLPIRWLSLSTPQKPEQNKQQPMCVYFFYYSSLLSSILLFNT